MTEKLSESYTPLFESHNFTDDYLTDEFLMENSNFTLVTSNELKSAIVNSNGNAKRLLEQFELEVKDTKILLSESELNSGFLTIRNGEETYKVKTESYMRSAIDKILMETLKF